MTTSSKVCPRQHLPKVTTLESLLGTWRDIDMEVSFSCEGVSAPPGGPCLHLLVLYRKQSLSSFCYQEIDVWELDLIVKKKLVHWAVAKQIPWLLFPGSPEIRRLDSAYAVHSTVRSTVATEPTREM